MVERARRGGRFARVSYKTPGGRNKVMFRDRNPGNPRCGKCGGILMGIPRKVIGLNKTKKSISRPFGGNLCSSCTKNQIKARVRS